MDTNEGAADEGQYYAPPNLSFVNAFWSDPFADGASKANNLDIGREGYEALLVRMRKGTKMLDEMRCLFRELAALELKRYPGVASIIKSSASAGNISICTSESLLDTEVFYNSQASDLHQTLSAHADRLLKFSGAREALLSKIGIEKSWKERLKLEKTFLAARACFRTSSMDIFYSTTPLLNEEPKEPDINASEKEVIYRREYEAAVNALEKANSSWIQKWESYTECCEVEEWKRLDLIKTVLIEYHQDRCIAAADEIKMAQSQLDFLSQVGTQADLTAFLQAASTGHQIPGKLLNSLLHMHYLIFPGADPPIFHDLFGEDIEPAQNYSLATFDSDVPERLLSPDISPLTPDPTEREEETKERDTQISPLSKLSLTFVSARGPLPELPTLPSPVKLNHSPTTINSPPFDVFHPLIGPRDPQIRSFSASHPATKHKPAPVILQRSTDTITAFRRPEVNNSANEKITVQLEQESSLERPFVIHLREQDSRPESGMSDILAAYESRDTSPVPTYIILPNLRSTWEEQDLKGEDRWNKAYEKKAQPLELSTPTLWHKQPLEVDGDDESDSRSSSGSSLGEWLDAMSFDKLLMPVSPSKVGGFSPKRLVLPGLMAIRGGNECVS